MEWYTISVDTHKSMKYLINKNPDAVPLKSVLTSKELNEANQLIDAAIEELNDQTIISLVSVFEQIMIEYLRKILDERLTSDMDNEVFLNIKEYTMKQAERGRFTDMIDCLAAQIIKNLLALSNKYTSIETG